MLVKLSIVLAMISLIGPTAAAAIIEIPQQLNNAAAGRDETSAFNLTFRAISTLNRPRPIRPHIMPRPLRIRRNTNKDCYTTGGPNAGALCVFPFKHGAIEYHDCTRAGHAKRQLWCSTKVDSTGRHLAGQNFFGTCSKRCFDNNPVTTGTVTSRPTSAPCTSDRNGGDSDPLCGGGTPAPTPDPCTSDRGTGGGSDPQCTGGDSDPLKRATCVTSSGPTSQQPCVFPFKYIGRTFTTCDVWRWGGKDKGKFWCSTKTDAKGNHIKGQGHYGFCPESQICRGDDLGSFNRILDQPESQVALDFIL